MVSDEHQGKCDLEENRLNVLAADVTVQSAVGECLRQESKTAVEGLHTDKLGLVAVDDGDVRLQERSSILFVEFLEELVELLVACL